MGVAAGMVIEGAAGAGDRIAAWPDADIDRIDRPVGVEGMPVEEAAEARQVDLAVAQGGIQAAPPAPMPRLQAEVDQRGLGTSGEGGVDEFEQGVRAAVKAGVEIGTESVERGLVGPYISHGRKYAACHAPLLPAG
jgi:hypothetical protein